MDVLLALLVVALTVGVGGQVDVAVLAASRPPYCDGSSLVGDVTLRKRLDERLGVIYRHQSCLLEEDDAATLDAVGIEVRLGR